MDGLTGAYGRQAGMAVLQSEVDRARRADDWLVLAFIDLDGLKATNDEHGHKAGDDRLSALVTALRSQVRSYEPIVRIGGDEFLCSLSGVDLDGARRRLLRVSASAKGALGSESVSIGLAELRADDTLLTLIHRADLALGEGRIARGEGPLRHATAEG
jgi:diguanylate cyclase (GGDEF)-like protein